MVITEAPQSVSMVAPPATFALFYPILRPRRYGAVVRSWGGRGGGVAPTPLGRYQHRGAMRVRGRMSASQHSEVGCDARPPHPVRVRLLLVELLVDRMALGRLLES